MASQRETFGSLHLWVNNAGGSAVRSPLCELTEADWDACLLVNLTAVWHASVIAAERMTDGGSIINVTSPRCDPRRARQRAPLSGEGGSEGAHPDDVDRARTGRARQRDRPGYVPTEVMMTALQTDVSSLERWPSHGSR